MSKWVSTGTRRLCEAKVFDADAGQHFRQHANGSYQGFEVFWSDGPCDYPQPVEDYIMEHAGWYWWLRFSACRPTREPVGPFSSSTRARWDADPEWLQV